MNLYPLMLDLTDRLAVVIGAGPVGLRKAESLRKVGARVMVVSLAGESGYRACDLDGATLVFAAAPPEVNAQVVADAKARGIWVNSANDPELGDFFVPALVRRGDLHIAISTGGTAPVLTRRLRERFEAEFDEAWAEWLEIQGELRGMVLDTIADARIRKSLFEQFAQPAWMERFRMEGRDSIIAAMRQVVEETVR